MQDHVPRCPICRWNRCGNPHSVDEDGNRSPAHGAGATSTPSALTRSAGTPLVTSKLLISLIWARLTLQIHYAITKSLNAVPHARLNMAVRVACSGRWRLDCPDMNTVVFSTKIHSSQTTVVHCTGTGDELDPSAAPIIHAHWIDLNPVNTPQVVSTCHRRHWCT